MELVDNLLEGFGNFCENLGKPLFRNEPVSRFSLTAAQKVTATKVGVAFLGAIGFAAGAALVAKAWTATYSFRKEVEILQPPSLQPELKKLKETVMNPIHLLGRVKMAFKHSVLPLVTGVFSLAGSVFVFTRFDKLLKAIK